MRVRKHAAHTSVTGSPRIKHRPDHTTYRSDMHFWKAGRIGSLVVEGDCILGHEAAGVVLKLGDGVSNLQIGMPMATTDSILEHITSLS